ncbi:MAG: cupin domain-containing protein [Verrucomicrobiota bacterium]
MNHAPWRGGIATIAAIILTGAAAAGDQKPAPPSVRFDRVQGVVLSASPKDRSLELRLPDGKAQRLRIASNASLRSIRGLDERELMIAPGDLAAIPPGMRHTIHNTGSDELVFLCTCAPGYEHTDTFLES